MLGRICGKCFGATSRAAGRDKCPVLKRLLDETKKRTIDNNGVCLLSSIVLSEIDDPVRKIGDGKRVCSCIPL